ncbi:ArnT family glycosyltransferase [Streptomyces sp. NPDC102270]|uniref:ArnT family glycosyltransferase n=1 Tax=Streptomyces sp. NPDC102270 TaxID=3366150 RepID=UPI0038032D42
MTTALDSPTASLPEPTSPPKADVRRGWEVWKSPADQPRWARPALQAVAALAALLYSWNITTSGYAPFYAVAARSMSESWKAFFYGALDPGATLTIDKLAGFRWPHALSARVFGFHAWSLTLPQVVEGVVTVLITYRVVRRWSGPVPGLLAAGIMTLIPVLASMFGHSMEDGALTMCLVLAADACQRAVLGARLLLAAGGRCLDRGGLPDQDAAGLGGPAGPRRCALLGEDRLYRRTGHGVRREQCGHAGHPRPV